MKILKYILALTLLATVTTSCYTDELGDGYTNNYNTSEAIDIHELLNSYEIWYVDIEETLGYGETPFLQKAFTLSFRNGILYANNNLVGFGSQGNGFGISIGYYDAYDMILDVDHDLDGFETFDVYQIDNNTIELYNPYNDTSYFLNGYQRSNFDYDGLFYDNTHYFLQEYEAWEKSFTSTSGAVNPFDNENFLQFLTPGTGDMFRSSQDPEGSTPNNIYWDFDGIYQIGGNDSYKTLTLEYNNSGSEFFDLTILDDQNIELSHTASGTVYRFHGRGYIQYLRQGEAVKSKTERTKKRLQRSIKKENLRSNTRKVK
jgi:hypothetical protein